ncbi:MAG: glutamate-cysteine ligase family protein [Fusicatenibacter sp.]
MYSELEKKNLELLEQYFRDGCKWNCVQKLGVEIEHFVVDDRSGKSVPYYGEHGIGQILLELKELYPRSYTEKGCLLGLYNADYSVSLEPAAQLEISIAPKDSVCVIQKIYESFLSQMEPVLKRHGCHLVNLGYQPNSKVNDLSLIPKKRYAYMDKYFLKSGTCGRNMMRGTASTQVSIDYCCEQDFVEKYRLAYLIMPALKLLSDNTPVFEGAPFEGCLARTYIWDRVDKERCGILPGLFEKDFGFHTYAEYLWNLKPIFLPVPGGSVYTEDQKTCEIWSDRLLTEEDLEHILSMTFLDVRLKNYIEIRGADSLPAAYSMAYTALVKGLTFEKGVREKLLEDFPICESDIRKAEASLQEKGFAGEIYGIPADQFCAGLLDVAANHLESRESGYLEPFRRLTEEKVTLGQKMRRAN